jgi:hypothetical protein
MSTKHTPGPWKVVPHGVEPENPDGCEFDVTVDTRSPVGMANARLIAAAPELLEALEAAVFALEPNGTPVTEAEKYRAKAATAARAALAKAKGETP